MFSLDTFVYSVGQVKLVGHLVREEQRLVARLFVAHRAGGGREGYECCDYGCQSFHDEYLFCLVSCCKVTCFLPRAERFFPNAGGEFPYSLRFAACVMAVRKHRPDGHHYASGRPSRIVWTALSGGNRNPLCVNVLRKALQKAVFRIAKGGLSGAERRPFVR